MAGNTIGSVFRVTTWGESHGEALGAVVDGCPSGLALSESDIQKALDRRKPSTIVSSTTRKESDRVEILSGVFEGKTTGTPVSLIIKNDDAKSSSYDELKDVFRPGQGDFTYLQKYGMRDWRGGGRASGRETAARVAAGAIAAKVIAQAGMDVIAYTQAIGTIEIDRDKMPSDKNLKKVVRDNALFCPDQQAAVAMEKRITAVRKKGDSLGGVVEIIVRGCPAGLGEPVFDKMDADLAKALMSIGSVKAVEIGDGFAMAGLKGSETNDQMTKKGFKTNHAGGILAGITNGNKIVLRAYCKPIPSIAIPQQTIDSKGKERIIKIEGRHDICVSAPDSTGLRSYGEHCFSRPHAPAKGDMRMKKIKVGIIGGTNGMGRWFASLLRKDGCTIHVCGRKTKLQIDDLVRLCNIIVVAVPISATADIIKQVGPLLAKDTLLMDLTSLKKEPVKLMLANSKAEVIGCHPLFGPQLKDVTGQNVILCPARGKKWMGWLKGVFKKNKMNVLEATPDKHDKMMAIVQALNHFNTIIQGMALANTNISLLEINKFSTPILRTKLDIIRKVFTESPDMYVDIISGNPETGKMLDIYEKALKDIRGKIKSGEKAKFKKTVTRTAKKLYGSKNK